MEVGEKKTESLFFGDAMVGRTYTGTVVYIHPAGRFYVVEFQFGDRAFRESFYFPERRGDPNAPMALPRARGQYNCVNRKKGYERT